MLFEVTHITRYSYDRPVFLEPQTIRLRPREGAEQRLESYALGVLPAPAGRTACLDLDGNEVDLVWFLGATDTLEFVSSFALQTTRINPFDFVLSPNALQLPMMGYPAEVLPVLTPYRSANGIAKSVADFAHSVAAESKWEVTTFLAALCTRLYERTIPTVRLVGSPQPAAQTLAEKTGACRDVSLLMMEACRAMGLATRFVSGYHESAMTADEPHLHAWTEVYLPGAGWRGYDASFGVAVADRHVALAAGFAPAAASPVSGSFRANGGTSTLHAEVKVKVSQSSSQTQSQSQRQF